MMRQTMLPICILALSGFTHADGIEISIPPPTGPVLVSPTPLNTSEESVLYVTSHADATDISALAGNGTCELREAVEVWRTSTSVDACPGADIVTLIVIDASAPIDLESPITLSLPVQGYGVLWIRGGRERRITGDSGHFLVEEHVELGLAELELMNGSRDQGGSIFSAGDLLIDDVTFRGNSAEEGGAIYSSGNFWAVDARFIGNSATTLGGGVRLDSVGLSLYPMQNVLFAENSAGVSGGGLYVEGGQEWTLDRVSLLENTAPDGAALAANGAHLEFLNVLVHGNNATAVNGAAIRIDAGEAAMEFVSVLDNDAVGVAFDNLSISHSILSGNTGGDCASLIPHDLFLFSHVSDDSCSGVGSGAAPLLPLADHGGKVLSRPPVWGSFLVDAGDPNLNFPAIPYDLRGSGFARIVGAAPDPGATEAATTGNSRPYVNAPPPLDLPRKMRAEFLEEGLDVVMSAYVNDNYGLDVASISENSHLQVLINGVNTGTILPIEWVLPAASGADDFTPPATLKCKATVDVSPEEVNAFTPSEDIVIDLVLPENIIYDLGSPALGNERAVVLTLVLEGRSGSSGGGGALTPPWLLAVFALLWRRRPSARTIRSDSGFRVS